MKARLLTDDHDSSYVILKFENVTGIEIYANKDGRLSLDVEGMCLVEDVGEETFECASEYFVNLRRLSRWHRRRSNRRMRKEMQRVADVLKYAPDVDGFAWSVTATGGRKVLVSGVAETEEEAESEAELALDRLDGVDYDHEYKIWVNGDFHLAVKPQRAPAQNSTH